ncbi:MAG: hypothetical protein GY835_15165 [bacterium]|nr:hypothetical protein [bacterium]
MPYQYLLALGVWSLEVVICLSVAMTAFNMKFRRICFDIGANELKYYRYSTLLGGVVAIDEVHSARRKYLLFSLGSLIIPALILASPPAQLLWDRILPHMVVLLLHDTQLLAPLQFLNYYLTIQMFTLVISHSPTLIFYPEEIERENVIKASTRKGISIMGRIFAFQRHNLKMRMVEIFRFQGPTTTEQNLFLLGLTGNTVSSTLAETILKAKRDINEEEIERLYSMVVQLQKTGIGFRDPEPGEIADLLAHREADDPGSTDLDIDLHASRLSRKLLRIINALGIPFVLDTLGYSWRSRNQPANAVVHFRKDEEEFQTRLIDIRKSDERGWFIDSLKLVKDDIKVREGETLDLLEINGEDLRPLGLRFYICRVGEETLPAEGGIRRRFFAGQVEAPGPQGMKVLHKAIGA